MKKRIDWVLLQPRLRRLKKEELLQVLADAYEALPASRVVSVFGEYVDLIALDSPTPSRKGATPRRLLDAVRKFHADSMAGRYYDSFDVNSKNFMESSEGTELWIEECRQLFDKCLALSAKGHHAEACQAMDLLFELLEEIDSGSDRIIFFADEGGSWQVGLEDEKILPAYFISLAAVAAPEAYAARVMQIVNQQAPYDPEKFLKAARKAASKTQREALAKQ